MSLGGALQIGRSALQAHQRAIEVAGHNLANIATRGYHRQTINLDSARDHEFRNGIFIGRGVRVSDINRHVDNALEGRIRANIANLSSSLARNEILSQVEALHNEFTDSDLTSHLDAFFNGWSELSNSPQDNSLRTLVLRQGSNLSDFVKDLRSELSSLKGQVDSAIDAAAVAANDLLDQIAGINLEIIQFSSRGPAPGLLDKRDALLAELSEYLDISIREQPTGAVDVFIGSLPVIFGSVNRGLEIRRLTVEDDLKIDLVLTEDGSVLQPSSGRLGSLIEAREGDVNSALDSLDDFINTFIFEVNKIHSQGQGLSGFDSVTATNRVLDTALAINDEGSGLKFTPAHGSFQLHVKQKSTGERVTTTIQLDLDGIDPVNDTTLTTLAANIDAVSGVNASITPDGRLKIDAGGSDFEFSFSNDSSGALAALGVNSFFSGVGGEDIAVNTLVDQNPSLIAAARDNLPGDNRNALALADLRRQPQESLGGLSVIESWSRRVEDFAVRSGQTELQLEADVLVGENLEAQQQAISGVNADEETINLLAFQRAYQGSARFLQVVDELLETLVTLA